MTDPVLHREYAAPYRTSGAATGRGATGTKHVVMFSGGVGSWATAKRVVAQYGADDTFLLFADVIVEDEDLYRFVIEAAGDIYGVQVADLATRALQLPDLWEMDARKTALAKLRKEANARIPGLRWIADGRTPWEVFHDVRRIGSSWSARCSHELKQDESRMQAEREFYPIFSTVYIGIDWSEIHRWERAREHWRPWLCEAPMCAEPYLDKSDMLAQLEAAGIKPPRLYAMGFPHNNCGGACVKAGIAQWVHLLKTMPKRYLWHEQQEQAVRDYLGKDVSILRDRSGGQSRPLTLRELRERPGLEIDQDDWGGCGCFLGDEVAASEDVPAD